MEWEAITAIATSLTVLAAIGAPMVMSVLNKPKVALVSLKPKAEWRYIWKDGKTITGAEIFVSVALENWGQEGTTINGIFEIKKGNQLYVFRSINTIRLEGEGTKNEEANMTLCCLFDKVPFQQGEILHGTLRLRPWGNRKLLLFGKRYIIKELDVPENQSNIQGMF